MAWADEVVQSARKNLGEGMEGALVFGSVGRGTPHIGSDIDLMLVVSDLPSGRGPRSGLAEEIEADWVCARASLPELTLILRTPAEIESGFPLLLDMAEDAQILFDPEGTVARLLDGWRERLAKAGARRIRTADGWHWDLSGGRKEWEL